MSIDWSKAPHDVMGYHPEKKGLLAHWVKWEPNGDHWSWVLDSKYPGWCVSPGKISKEYLAEVVDVPITWNGEGLPPVGTVCERRTHPDAQGGRYEEVRIIAYTSKGFPVWENTDAMFAGISKTQRMGAYPEFRPLRTPEQIEAEEREKGILQMAHDCGDWWKSERDTKCLPPIFDAMWKAGYRKQVAP